MRYQARSSVISSRFSRSFQPHSLCSYLGRWGCQGPGHRAAPDSWSRPRLHGLHVGLGEAKGPVHSGWLQAGHPLALNGDVEPEKRERECSEVAPGQHCPPAHLIQPQRARPEVDRNPERSSDRLHPHPADLPCVLQPSHHPVFQLHGSHVGVFPKAYSPVSRAASHQVPCSEAPGQPHNLAPSGPLSSKACRNPPRPSGLRRVRHSPSRLLVPLWGSRGYRGFLAPQLRPFSVLAF